MPGKYKLPGKFKVFWSCQKEGYTGREWQEMQLKKGETLMPHWEVEA